MASGSLQGPRAERPSRPRSRRGQQKLGTRLSDSERLRRCELPECRAACCLYGVWVDKLQVEEIFAHALLIAPHLPEDRRDPEAWFDGQEEPDAHALSGRVCHTTVLPSPGHYGGSHCTFLRPDYKCALQVAAEASGLHPWRFKPFYCVLHPMDLDPQGRITLAENRALLREPGSCLRPTERRTPLKDIFQPELDYLIGPETK